MSTGSPVRLHDELVVGADRYAVWRPDRIPGLDAHDLARRPRTTRILLENLVRHATEKNGHLEVARALAQGKMAPSDGELPFRPARVLLQDFTGVPVLVDLTSLREAAVGRGVRPEAVNPVIPVDLVVDHSVQVDSYGTRDSIRVNLDREYQRNRERYALLRWAQENYRDVRIVPPGNGIVHQVNLEYLASVATARDRDGRPETFPDSLVGTDSHTTMVNGLGVLGWGVGGIEAEAVMLGEPTFLSRPEIVGVRLEGRLPEGSTATDLVLTVTRLLRAKGVVDKFVEFYGPGLPGLSVPDRATISNMCPEYGATAALFPVDAATLGYLRGTARDARTVRRVEAYAKLLGLWSDGSPEEIEFDEHLVLDLASVVPTVSGPKNPEESVPLDEAPESFRAANELYRKAHPRPSPFRETNRDYPSDDPLKPFTPGPEPVRAPVGANDGEEVRDGAIVIAAITSCTNTSNPSVMVGAGLLARRARERGLSVPKYVKTSLAPGSKVVTDYLRKAELLPSLAALGFDLVGYGCTTCIGNSGPLPPAVERAIETHDAYVAAVLSGNRNFEARIHNLVRANYLMSPMLVVAYALAGRMDVNLAHDPLGTDSEGRPVYLRELWPRPEEIRETVEACLSPEMFTEKYRAITQGDEHWESLSVPKGALYPWDPDSTYLRDPPYFEPAPSPPPMEGTILSGARALAVLGDRVSTDHISPAGAIAFHSPAGEYLRAHGVADADFNTYGSRRGNHEVMVRGTFANPRLANVLVDREGGLTRHYPSDEEMTIFDAAERYRSEGVPLVVLAGRSYGQGSSRDWAAKGPALLGVRAVLAESYERIHRSNLVGMGILPLEYLRGETRSTHALTGHEQYELRLAPGQRLGPRARVEVRVRADDGSERSFGVTSRIDSSVELAYYRAGGILPFVLNERWAKPAAS